MPVRHHDSPAQRFRVIDSVFDVLVGMPCSAHGIYSRQSVDMRQARFNLVLTDSSPDSPMSLEQIYATSETAILLLAKSSVSS